VRKLLPLELESEETRDTMRVETRAAPSRAYLYEPSEAEIINLIVPRFTGLQLYQAVLESMASEHAARMVAMRSATDNANQLVEALRLQYNKARQQAITSDMLDIAGGAEALRAA
jgi:F-type H+-transporting ATPase subunit gamma